MSSDLEKEIRRLRVENEVTKIISASLKVAVLLKKNETIDDCKDWIEFLSRGLEVSIMQSWSLEESKIFRERIDEEIRELSSYRDSRSAFLIKRSKRLAAEANRRR